MNKNEINAKINYILRSMIASKEQKQQLGEIFSEVVATANEGLEEPNVDQIKSDVDNIKNITDGIVNLGTFKTPSLAWEAAAQQALNYNTVHDIIYYTNNNDYVYTSGHIDQHYYYSTETDSYWVYQYMHAEGKTNKQYIRTIKVSTNNTIISIGEWEDYKLADNVSSLSSDATLSDVITTINNIITKLQEAKLMK